MALAHGTEEGILFFSFVIGAAIGSDMPYAIYVPRVTRTSHTHYTSKMVSDKCDDSIMPVLDIDDKASVFGADHRIVWRLNTRKKESDRTKERHTRSLH